MVAQITTPTGLKTLKTYDNLGRMVSLAGQRSDSNSVNSFTYSYDAAGQRNKETMIDRTRDYTYDPWRQLQQARKAAIARNDVYNRLLDNVGRIPGGDRELTYIRKLALDTLNLGFPVTWDPAREFDRIGTDYFREPSYQ